MASTAWIESAAHERKPVIGTNMGDSYQHTLVMARADEEREAHDRVLAARAVQRLGGDEAAEILAMLGLTGAPEPEPPVQATPARTVPAEKLCPDCGETKPAAEYVSRPRHKDGLETYCRACGRKRKNEWKRRRRAGQKTGVSQ